MALAITPSFLAYSDFILTEGLTIPLALLLACLVSNHFRLVQTDLPDNLELFGQRLPAEQLALATAWAAAVVAFALMLIRYPFVVFGMVPLTIWWASRERGEMARPYLAALLVFLAAASVLTLGLSAENSTEVGVFRPTVRGERAMYWSAWHLVFTLHPENRNDETLAGFYDAGSPYPHIWDVEAANPRYADQAQVLNRSIDQMLTAAGLDPRRERLFSFLGALTGGRHDEVRPRIEQILNTDASSVDEAIHVNDVSRQQGWEVFNDRYNEGSKPQSVITSPAFPSPPMPYVADTLRLLLPAALIGICVFAFRRRQYWLASVYLVPVVAFSAALAWILADNVRFFMTTSVYAVAGLSALWASGARGRSSLISKELGEWRPERKQTGESASEWLG